MNGRYMIGITMLLAPSGLFDTRPRATPSHVSEKHSSTRKPMARSQSVALAFGLKPASTATPSRSTTLAIDWITLPNTCPVSSEVREIAIVRNRAMMPSVRSVQTLIAVCAGPMARVMMTMPGVR